MGILDHLSQLELELELVGQISSDDYEGTVVPAIKGLSALKVHSKLVTDHASFAKKVAVLGDKT